MKYAFFIIAIFYFPCLIIAENSKTSDSLKEIIGNKFLQDTTRARAALKYVAITSDTSTKEKFALLEYADSIANKYNYEKLKVGVFIRKLEVYESFGDLKRMEIFKTATDFQFYCQQQKDTLNEARAYFYRAVAYRKFDMIDKSAIEEVKGISLLKEIHYAGNMLIYNQYLAGFYLFNSKNYKDALHYFKLSYNGLVTSSHIDTGRLVTTTGWIGTSYNGLHIFDSALFYRYKSLSIQKKWRGDLRGIADCYRYLGDVYYNMGNYDSALAIYQRSVAFFVKSNPNDKTWLMQFFIVRTYFAKKDYQASAKILDEILDSVHGCKEFLPKYLSCKIAGDVYYANKQFEKSIKAYQHIIQLDDSMQQSADVNNVDEMNMKMELEGEQQLMQTKQEQQAVLAKKDKEHQIFIRNVFVGSCFFLLLLAGILYRNFLQKKKANAFLVQQKKEIQLQKEEIEYQKTRVDEKNKEVLDSIIYAKRLQDAILPPLSIIKKHIPESFILYKPKDIVAGDFYWMERAGDNILIAACDCTGHGIPGALVSVVCSNALNRTVKEFKITEPGKILDKVRELVLETFEKSESEVQDGMDISLCCLNTQTKELQWSGANNPLWYIEKGELKEVAPDKQPIGKFDLPKPFNTASLKLQKGDILYLFTDGYADQFGGPKGKKFKYKQLQEKLLAMNFLSMDEQKDMLNSTLESWKGSLEQVDDILVMGIRV